MKVLVIPSNRPERLKGFFEAWQGRGGWDQVILVEDAPVCSKLDLPADTIRVHYSWEDIDADLGDRSWIISRQDSAIRCYGFWKAWQLGADYVLTLDDDCYYESVDDLTFFDRHIGIMDRGYSVWTPSAGERTRGLPYFNAGTLGTVVANMGLWTGSGDPDAIQGLSRPITDFQPPRLNWLVPANQLTNLCGMNLCIARRALPLFYFPLMGQSQPYRRFDDIWAGIIAKRCMDALGWNLSVGEPFVEHRRASDPMKNLLAEAPGIAANETFWECVPMPRRGATAQETLTYLAGSLMVAGSFNPEYMSKLRYALKIWVSLFQETP